MAESDRELLPASGRFRWFALLLGVAGVLVGIAATSENAGAGIVIISWFSLVTLAALRQVWPGANYLRITPQGFEVRGILQHYFVPWVEVEEFFIWRMACRQYIGFRLTQSSSLKARGSEMTLGVGWRRPHGVDGLLPYSSYGSFTPQEVVLRLNRWRAKALSSPTDREG